MSLVFGSAVFNESISGNGVSTSAPILVATTTAGTLNTSFQQASVIDGVTLSSGNRILIKNQASGIENGVYMVSVSGAPVRAVDVATGTNIAGKVYQIMSGTVNADTSWVATNDPPSDVVGVDSLTFEQLSKIGAGSFIAGPNSSTIGRLAVWNNTTGTELRTTTSASIDASDNLTGINTIGFTGTNPITITKTAQTVGSAALNIPDLAGVADTFGLTTHAQTLLNKTLTAPVISSITNSGVITIPSGTDTLVARATSDTLTNKTVTDSSNNVAANSLKTTGAPVAVSQATPPAAGQVLAAVTGTSAAWSYQGWRQPVVAASTGNIILSGDLNGTTVDAITIATGDRILFKDQTSPIQNGIYIIGNGPGATARSDDMAAGSSISMVFVYCAKGTVSAGRQFVCSNPAGSDVVGIDSLTFTSGGGVAGPIVTTDTALVRWSGTTGSDLLNSGITLDVLNNLSGINSLLYTSGVALTTVTQTVGPAGIAVPDLAGVSRVFATTDTTQTLINKTLQTPYVTANIAVSTIPFIAIQDNFANGFYSTISSQSNPLLTADRSLTLNLRNANRALNLGGDITITGSISSTLPSISFTSGSAINAVLTFTGAGTVTFPSTGTLATLLGTETLGNKTITSGRFNQLLDTAGNTELILSPTASAVNQITVANAATGGSPSITASGTDTNINLELISKGTGGVEIKNTNTTLSGELRLYENSSSGTAYVGLKAPQADAGFTANTIYTFPANVGLNGQYMMTNGAGGLSWNTPATGVGAAYNMINSVTTFTTTSTTYVLITDMTVTPVSGIYYVVFSSSASISATSTRFNYGIAIAGTVDANSVRSVSSVASASINIINSVHTMAICSVNGAQAITAQMLRAAGTGTVTVTARSLYIFKLA